MQKQTPEWLTHFITAFGTNGVIAMAWWVGARNASAIRDVQRSYPFLQIVPAGPDQLDVNDLLGTLSVLSGAKDADVLSHAELAPAALRKALFDDTNLPLVLTETGGAGHTFDDWDMLKPMFNNGSFRSVAISTGIDAHCSGKKFARGLVFVAKRGEGPRLPGRTVELSVDLKCLVGAMKLAEQVLHLGGRDLLSLDVTGAQQMFYHLGGMGGHFTAMPKNLGHAPSIHNALNHAQLIGLVRTLVDAFGLPEDVASSAIHNIHAMAADMAEIQP